jgi:hypothetical protein
MLMVYVIQFISAQPIYIKFLYFPLLNMSFILITSLIKVTIVTVFMCLNLRYVTYEGIIPKQ